MKQEITGGIVLCVIGLILFLMQPEWLWKLTERWKTEDGIGPSKSYAILVRGLGVVFASAGFALTIWGGVSA